MAPVKPLSKLTPVNRLRRMLGGAEKTNESLQQRIGRLEQDAARYAQTIADKDRAIGSRDEQLRIKESRP